MTDKWLKDETYKGRQIMFLKTTVDDRKPFNKSFVMAIDEKSHVDLGSGDNKKEAFQDVKDNWEK